MGTPRLDLGKLHWTHSFHFDPDDECLKSLGIDRSSLERIKDLQEHQRLNSAIADFIQDIADIGANDLLLFDTSRPRKLDVEFPDPIMIDAEGRRKSHPRPTNYASILFPSMTAFWSLLKDGSLVFNLSVEAHYRHDATSYLYLTILQNSVSQASQRRTRSSTSQPIFRAIVTGAREAPHDFSSFFEAILVEELIFLSSATGNRTSTRRKEVPEFKYDSSRTKTLWVFDDPHLLAQIPGETDKFQRQKIPPRDRTGTDPQAPKGDMFAGLSDDALDCLFIAGFCQNIVDFAAQDGAEVDDGINAQYIDDDFRDFATEESIIEFSGHTRSLDEGSRIIGTCPYIFFVHLISLHNEIISIQFEKKSREAWTMLERSSGSHLSPGRFANLDAISRMRTDVFTRIRPRIIAEIFNYETERDKFDKISKRRRTKERIADAQSEIKNTEDVLRELARTELRRERQQGRFLMLIAAVGMFSAVFDFINITKDWDIDKFLQNPLGYILLDPHRTIQAIAGAMLLLLLAVVVAYFVRILVRDKDLAGGDARGGN